MVGREYLHPIFKVSKNAPVDLQFKLWKIKIILVFRSSFPTEQLYAKFLLKFDPLGLHTFVVLHDNLKIRLHYQFR